MAHPTSRRLKGFGKQKPQLVHASSGTFTEMAILNRLVTLAQEKEAPVKITKNLINEMSLELCGAAICPGCLEGLLIRIQRLYAEKLLDLKL